jgi:D-alanyl-D-alanine carboxypeptidase
MRIVKPFPEEASMISIKRTAGLALSLFLLSAPAAPAAAVPRADDEAWSKRIDAVMSEVYKPGEPGAAIIVRKDGRTIFRKGYGMADLELGVPVEPDMVFRLGSITKQFTAVSVLMLAAQGKLSLGDEITKYLPDVPTGGKAITIEHLLTHTSGIKSYTNMEEWLPMWRKDMTPGEIIALSKGKPLEFDPGTRWNYNNTGYVILGALIEKISGETYEGFVNAHIFAPLGMKHSHYGNVEPVIPRRVPGYQKGKDGFVNAPYLSMTQPYAAGSLISSVDDMAVWNEAVFSGRLVGKEWLDKAFTPFRLANGESTGYGYGWFVAKDRGHLSIEHGGGIPGFTSYEMAFPADGLFICILTNAAAEDRAPEPRAVKIADAVLGRAEPERKPVALAPGDMDALTGVYENADKQMRYITREGEKLYSQRAGGPKKEVQAASPMELFFADDPARIKILKDAGGKVTGLRLEDRLGPAELYERTAKPLPAPRKEIALAPEVLDRYVGEYELAPGFTATIVNEGGRLMSLVPGQPKVELFAESETKFFLKAVDAEIEFVADASGRVTGLVLRQGGTTMPGKRTK